MLCQSPVHYGPAAEGTLPVNMDNFTPFGRFICEQVVLYTHQRVSRLPEYTEQPTEVPAAAFRFIEDLAVCLRPYFHPVHYLDLE